METGERSPTVAKLLQPGELFRLEKGGTTYLTTSRPPLGEKGDIQAKETCKSGRLGGYITDVTKLPGEVISIPPNTEVIPFTQ